MSKIALERAEKIAEELKRLLEPACHRIEIAGSIRRQKPEVGDIELLCIPQQVEGIDILIDKLDTQIGALMGQGLLDYRLNKRGSRVYGPKNKLLLHRPSGIGVDIFSTTEECWSVALVVRTGGKRTNKEIAYRALERGMSFHAYGSGFSTPNGEIVCRSEQEVFEAVGLRYQRPEERG